MCSCAFVFGCYLVQDSKDFLHSSPFALMPSDISVMHFFGYLTVKIPDIMKQRDNYACVQVEVFLLISMYEWIPLMV